jgi:RNA polymerase-binding transcription factor DksA
MTHDEIKQRLLQRRRRLLARYHGEVARANEELESHEIEEIENATEQWDARVLSHLGDADAHALSRVVAALVRLQEGRYGRCVACDGPIAAARLRAVPETDTCYDCAVTAERLASA